MRCGFFYDALSNNMLSTRHCGAGSGTRTHTGISPTDFESASSTNSNIPAWICTERKRTGECIIHQPVRHFKLYFALNQWTFDGSARLL